MTLTGKTRGAASMPSEGSPVLTLWFAVCLGHRFVKERLTFTILQQLAVPAVVGSLGRKVYFGSHFGHDMGAEAGGSWSRQTHSH